MARSSQVKCLLECAVSLVKLLSMHAGCHCYSGMLFYGNEPCVQNMIRSFKIFETKWLFKRVFWITHWKKTDRHFLSDDTVFNFISRKLRDGCSWTNRNISSTCSSKLFLQFWAKSAIESRLSLHLPNRQWLTTQVQDKSEIWSKVVIVSDATKQFVQGSDLEWTEIGESGLDHLIYQVQRISIIRGTAIDSSLLSKIRSMFVFKPEWYEKLFQIW
jgi:hypothetical protein